MASSVGSWLASAWFLFWYNFTLREVRALMILVIGGPVGLCWLLPKLVTAPISWSTIGLAISVWLFVCNRLARGPMAVFRGADFLKGKTCLITGGNTGLGRETALGLARMGADRVIIACRDTRKADDAVKYITAANKGGSTVIEVRALDLGSFASVRALTASLKADQVPIDILINNAGVMNSPYRLTTDGFEEHIGINHLGHMLLTVELLDVLRARKARVVTVASSGHAYRCATRFPTVDSWLYPDPKTWIGMDRFWQYCNSKLANVLFTRVLQQKLAASGASAYCCHPGVIATELTRSLPFLAFLASFASPFVAKSWTEGAQPSLYLATDPAAKPVAWHHDVSEATGAVEVNDDVLATELWVKSCTALKIQDPQ